MPGTSWITSRGLIRGCSRSTQVLPFLVMPSGQVQAVPAALRLAGGRHVTGSTQRLPRRIWPSGQADESTFTHSLPLSVVPAGQTQEPGNGPAIIGGEQAGGGVTGLQPTPGT